MGKNTIYCGKTGNGSVSSHTYLLQHSGVIFCIFFYRVFKCYLMIEKIISYSQYTLFKLFVLFPFQGGSYFACHPIDLD